jgi:SAM-dependent methyltransferase
VAERLGHGHDLSGHALRYGLALPFASGRDVLDAGSGTGYGTRIMQVVAKSVQSIDLEPSGLPSVVADVTKMPFMANSFDVATSFEVIEHLPQQDGYLRQLQRVLRPDGVLLLSTPNGTIETLHNRVTGYYNPYHVALLSPQRLTAILAEHFHDVAMVGQAASTGIAKDLARFSDRARLHLRLRVKRTEPVAVQDDDNRLGGDSVVGPAAEQPWVVLSRLGATTSPALFAICRRPRKIESAPGPLVHL